MNRSTPYTVAFVYARGGSKAVPDKNLREVGGIPLVGHSVIAALEAQFVDRVVVSTDSERIATVAQEFGAEVLGLRPPELSKDDSAEPLAWAHSIGQYEQMFGEENPMQLWMSVPPTSPLRMPSDLDACIEAFQDSNADMVITVTDAHRSPQFNMVNETEDGYVNLVMPPDSALFRRQDVPPVFDVATVAYVGRPDFVRSLDAITTAYRNRVVAVHIPSDRAIDIDTETDLRIVNYLYDAKNSDE